MNTDGGDIDISELEKMRAVSDTSQKIGEFIDWLKSTKHVQFMVYNEDDRLMPYYTTINEMLAEFFEIDLKKVEEQRLALLHSIRKEQHK